MKCKKVGKFILCASTVFGTSYVACAASEYYSSHYSMTNSVHSRVHKASGTPTCKIKTSNMTGELDNDLWVELDKKNIFGYYASAGRTDGKNYTTVPSDRGTTFSLLGNGAGSYRICFLKCNPSSEKWYADLDISYNK